MADLTVNFQGKEFQVRTFIPKEDQDPDDFYELLDQSLEASKWDQKTWAEFDKAVSQALYEHDELSFGGD